MSDECTKDIARAVENMLCALPVDAQREGLLETPMRYAKAMQFWTSGYKAKPADILKTFKDGSENYDEMVFVGKIPYYSLCEHHLAPFFGVAHVGYIPEGRIVGLSKIPRLVEVFARRLSVQERLTVQIADTLDSVLKPKGVGVIVQGRHLCMESRGIQKPGTITTTSALRGVIKHHAEARAEFLKMIELSKGGLR